MDGDLFGPWGDNGERPPDGMQYSGGDGLNEKHVDYLFANLYKLENQVQSDFQGNLDATTYKGVDINEDGDDSVDQADYASDANATRYKGNDIDTNGNGIVDVAHKARRYPQTYDMDKTLLKPGDAIKKEQYIPEGYTIRFHRVGVEPDGTTVPSGLVVQANDVTNNVQFFQESGRFVDYSTSESKNTDQAGPIKVEMKIVNGSGNDVMASGQIIYEISPDL